MNKLMVEEDQISELYPQIPQSIIEKIQESQRQIEIQVINILEIRNKIISNKNKISSETQQQQLIIVRLHQVFEKFQDLNENYLLDKELFIQIVNNAKGLITLFLDIGVSLQDKLKGIKNIFSFENPIEKVEINLDKKVNSISDAVEKSQYSYNYQKKQGENYSPATSKQLLQCSPPQSLRQLLFESQNNVSNLGEISNIDKEQQRLQHYQKTPFLSESDSYCTTPFDHHIQTRNNKEFQQIYNQQQTQIEQYQSEIQKLQETVNSLQNENELIKKEYDLELNRLIQNFQKTIVSQSNTNNKLNEIIDQVNQQNDQSIQAIERVNNLQSEVKDGIQILLFQRDDSFSILNSMLFSQSQSIEQILKDNTNQKLFCKHLVSEFKRMFNKEPETFIIKEDKSCQYENLIKYKDNEQQVSLKDIQNECFQNQYLCGTSRYITLESCSNRNAQTQLFNDILKENDQFDNQILPNQNKDLNQRNFSQQQQEIKQNNIVKNKNVVNNNEANSTNRPALEIDLGNMGNTNEGGFRFQDFLCAQNQKTSNQQTPQPNQVLKERIVQELMKKQANYQLTNLNQKKKNFKNYHKKRDHHIIEEKENDINFLNINVPDTSKYQPMTTRIQSTTNLQVRNQQSLSLQGGGENSQTTRANSKGNQQAKYFVYRNFMKPVGRDGSNSNNNQPNNKDNNNNSTNNLNFQQISCSQQNQNKNYNSLSNLILGTQKCTNFEINKNQSQVFSPNYQQIVSIEDKNFQNQKRYQSANNFRKLNNHIHADKCFGKNNQQLQSANYRRNV